MEFNTYQQSAMQYRMKSADASYAMLGLSGEVGELHSLIAKGIRDGLTKDFKDQAIKELGDVLWFVAAIAADLETSLDQVATTNISKLADRAARNKLSGSGDNR